MGISFGKVIMAGAALIATGLLLTACGEVEQEEVAAETAIITPTLTRTPSMLPPSTQTPVPTPNLQVTTYPSNIFSNGEDDLIAFRVLDDTEDMVTIYLVHPDGSDLTEMVTLPARMFLGREYSWSPDGRKIAFTQNEEMAYNRSYYYQIFTLDIYSGELFQVTNGQTDHRYPVWLPDGSGISFLYGDDYLLSIVDVDGGNLRTITTIPDVGNNYSWSPDGTQIACSSGFPPFDFSIWFMDANGENAYQFETEYLDLDIDYAYAAIATWTPDGEHLVFLKQHDLYYGDIEGEFSIRLTFTLDYPELWFDVSPDGSMIAFINFDGTDVFMKIIDLQGNVISDQNIGNSFVVDFDWSLDSQTIVLTMDDQLWLFSVADQSLLKLLDCPAKCRDPQWQP